MDALRSRLHVISLYECSECVCQAEFEANISLQVSPARDPEPMRANAALVAQHGNVRSYVCRVRTCVCAFVCAPAVTARTTTTCEHACSACVRQPPHRRLRPVVVVVGLVVAVGPRPIPCECACVCTRACVRACSCACTYHIFARSLFDL